MQFNPSLSCFNPLLSMQVYRVLFPYSPHKDDELELLDGDYVYVSTTDQGQTGTYLVHDLMHTT